MNSPQTISLSSLLVSPIDTSENGQEPISKIYKPRQNNERNLLKINQSMQEIPPPKLPCPITSNKTISYSTPLFFRVSPYPLQLSFEDACLDPHFVISPMYAGFIPLTAWGNMALPFGILVHTFFQKRNSLHCKFPFKLYNSLRLTLTCPDFYRYVGVKWITDNVFIVDKFIFARLLGIKTIDGSFFHQQGNFPSHGFEELPFSQATQIALENGIGSFDPSILRFLRHTSGNFTAQSTESDILHLKWSRAC